MTDENSKQFDELLAKRLAFANNADAGSEEEKQAISDIATLMSRQNESYKIDASWDESVSQLAFEKEKLEKELALEREKADIENTRRLEEGKRSTIVAVATTIGGSVISILLQQFFMRANMKDCIEYEKTDSFSTTPGRRISGNLFGIFRK